MAGKTEHFGLTKLGPGDSIHSGDGRFPNADRETIDQQLYRTATHRHTGVAGSQNQPETAPDLTLGTTGEIAASVTATYVFTFVDPETGETKASPEASITLPDSILEPAAPTFTLQSIGGTLEPGQYFYAASAYQGASTVETKATNSVSVVVPSGTSTNQVELTLPALPPGADGYNIYRLAPNESRYSHIGTTTTTSFVDAGEASTSRSLPSTNSTNGTNSVTLDISAVTPSLPSGNNWRIYRTYSTDWSSSFLTEVVANGATPITSYTDVGDGTSFGSPPDAGLDTGQPSQIDLTAEVQNTLPVANGGTEASTAPVARQNLGVEIGVDVQAHSTVLDNTTAAYTTAKDAIVTDAVTRSGDQAIAGTKEFTSKIVVPTPVDSTDAATKAYVDAAGGGGGGGGTGDLSVDARQNLRLWQLEASVLGMTEDMEGWQGEAFLVSQDEIASNLGPQAPPLVEERSEWSITEIGGATPHTGDLNDINYITNQDQEAVWVLVGDGGVIFTSEDHGVTWTSQSSPVVANLNAVIEDHWWTIAVGDGVVVTSSAYNFVTWTQRTNYTGGNLYAIDCAASDQSIAVGAGGEVWRSDDNGVNWAAQTSGVTEDLHGISAIYQTVGDDAGTYVAVGLAGTVITTVDSGLTAWTVQTSGLTGDLFDIDNDGSRFVAVGNDGAATPAGLIASSDDNGATWTVRHSPAEIMTKVHYANGEWLAVGDTGALYVSSDGETWTSETTGVVDNLTSVFYESSIDTENYWIAVGDGGTAIRSHDPVSPPEGGSTPGLWQWSSEPISETSTLNGMAFGNGVFVIISGPDLYYSTDGKNWTLAGPFSTLRVVHFADGQFIAAGDSGSIYTSPDGINWTSQSSGTTSAIHGLAHDGTKWMAIGSSASARTSPDGITWTETGGTPSVNNQLTYGDGYWVTWLSTSVKVSTDDGVTWSSPTADNDFHVNMVRYLNGYFVAALGFQKGIMWTLDPTLPLASWTQVDVTPDGFNDGGTSLAVEGVEYDNGVYMAVGTYGFFATSTDLASWNYSNVPFDTNFNGIYTGAVYGNGVWVFRTNGDFTGYGEPVYLDGAYIERNADVELGFAALRAGGVDNTDVTGMDYLYAIGHDGSSKWIAGGRFGLIMESSDGVNWSEHSQSGSVISTNVASVAFANSTWIIFADGQICYSTDGGATFTASTGQNTFRIYEDAAYDSVADRWVAAGEFNIKVYSDDGGATWTETGVLNTSDGLRGIEFDGTTWVAIGNGGTLNTSTDGVNWNDDGNVGVTSVFYSIAYNSGLFVIVGFSGNIFTSPDGFTWTQQTSPTSETLFAVEWIADRWVVVGTLGEVLVSLDGVEWTILGATGHDALRGITFDSAASRFVAAGYDNAAGVITHWIDKEATEDLAVMTTTSVPLAEVCDSVYFLSELVAPGMDLATPTSMVTYEASLNGGTSWTTLVVDDTTVFSPGDVGTELVVRVTLERTDPSTEAHLYWFIAYAGAS